MIRFPQGPNEVIFLKPRLITAAALLLGTLVSASAFASAPQQSQPEGYIYGYADPGAQIVVIDEKSGAISGVVAKSDGTYRTSALTPGKYSIQESGEHHAMRHLEITEGKGSNVDLAPHAY
jgi:hypothetical protein